MFYNIRKLSLLYYKFLNPRSIKVIDAFSKPLKVPKWFKIEKPQTNGYYKMLNTLRSLEISTVCKETKCPNIGECWAGGPDKATATIMLMGDTCTRACRFCSVKTSLSPKALDPLEPEKVTKAIKKWGLKYVVLTMVNRDDLPDGGAKHVANTIKSLKKMGVTVECLIGDFCRKTTSLDMIIDSGLDVLAHNIETVRELTPVVRDPKASYDSSLYVLNYAKKRNPYIITKSGIMLGLGETKDQISKTLSDLSRINVTSITLGQYMQPSHGHLPVIRYISPVEFKSWYNYCKDLGFKSIASGPLVRSSYRAHDFFKS